MKKTVGVLSILFVLIVSVFAVDSHSGTAEKKRTLPVLLVMDIQKAFMPYMSDQDKKGAIETTNAVIALFRDHQLPIIRVYHSDPKWGSPVDSSAFQFDEGVQIKSDDVKIVKNYGSAFKKTDLEKILREKGCNTIFLCGLSATACVLATYEHAELLDFNVFMVKDALMSPNPTHTATIYEICQTIPYGALKLVVEGISAR